MTAQWMSSVSRTVSQAHVMSSAMALLNEFRLSGRFRVLVATLSATSNRMASRSMVSSLGPGAVRGKMVHSLFRVAAGRAGQTASHKAGQQPAGKQPARHQQDRERGTRR